MPRLPAPAELDALPGPLLQQLRGMYPEGSAEWDALTRRIVGDRKPQTKSKNRPTPAVAAPEPERIPLPPGGYRLVIHGAPRTKKTSNSLQMHDGRLKVVPSAAWMAWRDASLPQIPKGTLPDQLYNCAALFYRDRATGDATGYYQGLADILEEAGVVSNDKWIESWNGSRRLLDRDNPRVELVISALT